MSVIIEQRMTAEAKDEFVVFLIGMRINKLWKIHKWMPVALAMPKMIKSYIHNQTLGFWVTNSGLVKRQSWFSTGNRLSIWSVMQKTNRLATSPRGQTLIKR